MALPHVVGAGIGLCGSDICIKVMVAELTPELMRQVEEILGQYPYAVEVTESLHPLPSGQHR